jgi:hypothetical protein
MVCGRLDASGKGKLSRSIGSHSLTRRRCAPSNCHTRLGGSLALPIRVLCGEANWDYVAAFANSSSVNTFLRPVRVLRNAIWYQSSMRSGR